MPMVEIWKVNWVLETILKKRVHPQSLPVTKYTLWIAYCEGLLGKVVTKISAGSKHSMAVTNNNEVFSWVFQRCNKKMKNPRV
jgi:alpha-tubulin suppressor-like RCC1 family protein